MFIDSILMNVKNLAYDEDFSRPWFHTVYSLHALDY